MQRSRRIKYNTVKKAKGSAREGGTGQQTNEARGAETMSQETDSQGQTLSAFEMKPSMRKEHFGGGGFSVLPFTAQHLLR